MSYIIKNAKIVNTKFGVEQGILTFFLTLDYGNGQGQLFGGVGLDQKAVIASEQSLKMIKKLLSDLGVFAWEFIKGINVKVKLKENKIVAIGNILADDTQGLNWFSFDEFINGKENG